MAITLSSAYLAKLKEGVNEPNVILELTLDGGTVKWGYSTGGFSDVLPIVKSVSSLQNKLDTKGGFATLGQITVVVSGRDNFKRLLKDEYLKNRRVVRKDGFRGLAYGDYASTFTGTIQNWSRRGDELSVTIADDMIKAKKKIPVENSTKTQQLDYRATNPVDIMLDILSSRLGVGASYLDTAQFEAERDIWLPGWKFDRVLTKPEDAIKYLGELQVETNSYIVHDGEKVSFKYFGPSTPGEDLPLWDDSVNILDSTLTQKSGYSENFFNRVVFYYDYDESGSDKPENFEAVYIATDSSSQSSSEWDEVKTKVIKSRWIRTTTFTQPVNISGVTLYHASVANGLGDGTLVFDLASNTLKWTAPGGTQGEAVTLDNDGKYQVFDSSKSKWVRVLVEVSNLPSSNKSESITITALSGDSFAGTIADKLLKRYRSPVSTVNFQVDINDVASGSSFLKPTDMIDLTTDEACGKDNDTWSAERMMITSLRPDFSGARVGIEALQTRMYHRYGFIAPASYPDYPSATEDQREYAFIGDLNNKVNGGMDDGYYVW